MNASLSSGVGCLLDRFGDGHGRRALVRATGVMAADVRLATGLARKAWAVCVWVRDADSAELGLACTGAAGLVVDWRTEGLIDDATQAGRFSAVAHVGDPGLDHPTGAELRHVLQQHGLLLVVLAHGVPIPDLTGFSGVSVAKREDVALVSARRL